MDHRPVVVRFRHEERVHEDFSEKAGGSRDRRRNENLMELADLALMARLAVPFDVSIEERPPETVGEAGANNKDALMAKVVMSFAQESESLSFRHIDLVLSGGMPFPQFVVHDEEAASLPN